MDRLKDDHLQELRRLRMAPETVRALFLLPVVEVAWADGAVQRGERQSILTAAAERGLLDEAGRQVVRSKTMR